MEKHITMSNKDRDVFFGGVMPLLGSEDCSFLLGAPALRGVGLDLNQNRAVLAPF